MRRPYLNNSHEDSQLIDCLTKIEDFYSENLTCKILHKLICIDLQEFNAETFDIL
jgi:hypothetical protein